MLRLWWEDGKKWLIGRWRSRVWDKRHWPIAAEIRTQFEEANKTSSRSSDVIATVRRLAEELSNWGARTPKDVFALLCAARKLDEATLRKILHVY